MSGTGSTAIVGREAELAAVSDLLDRARSGLGVLLLEGEAGIGKTTLFRESLGLAETAGLCVLASRPSAFESALSLTAIADLLHGIGAEHWHDLPAAQRRALEVVVDVRDPESRPVRQRAIGAGLRSLVTRVAAERPVLIALDDVHWLDPASATIVEYVVRRLAGERVAVLLAKRSGEPTSLDVDGLAAPETFARVRLQPFGAAALGKILSDRLERPPSRATLSRLHSLTGGNPLFAIELGRMVEERDGAAPHDPLPVPDDVQAVVAERVAALPRPTRELLLAASLLAEPTTDVLGAVFEQSPYRAIAAARRAGIADVVGEKVRFAHPLHASAVIGAATPQERRAMHERLAASVKEVEERARHLARVAERPDSGTAALLEEGATAALGRGGLHSAAELLEEACAFTPLDRADERHDRAARAADLHARAGERGRAEALLDELLADELEPARRAIVLRLRAELHMANDEPAAAERLLLAALESSAGGHDHIRAKLVLCYLRTLRLDFAAAAEWGREAVGELGTDADPGLQAEVLAYSAMAAFLAGDGVDRQAIDRAFLLEDPDRKALPGMSAGGVAATILMYVGLHGEARELMSRLAERLVATGDDGDLANVLFWRSWLETRAGDFAAAARAADDAIDCARLNRHESLVRFALAQRAWIDAHRGDVAEARRNLGLARTAAERSGVAQIQIWGAATEALLGLSVGDHRAAWQASSEMMEALEHHGITEPVPAPFVPDALEALIALGDLERADAFLEKWESRARELDRVWAIATGSRCRALLLSARGDGPGALAAVEQALEEHDRLDMPFERARTKLVQGSVERRARRRRAARATLTEAAEEFERLGARLWVERARSELERVEGRRPGNPNELTPSERRVAVLAAGGRSNKEIAQALAVTPHTVEVHLSRAYAKLDIHTRAQLRQRLPPGHEELEPAQ
jgi:DNA-binding CsgD family transcriptional regulator